MPTEIYTLRTEPADVWVAWDGDYGNAYAYGGCRMVHWRTRNEDAIGLLCSLMENESGYKNTLINLALEAGALDGVASKLPPGFAQSRVGGARCVMRPADEEAASIMSNPRDPRFGATLRRIFEPLGALLNATQGRVKLTPDFGKFASMADALFEYTPHALGVSRELGGCGGKSTYSATGVLAAYEALEEEGVVDSTAVTHVGSAGAMGTTVLEHLLERGDRDVTVCDLKYDDGAEPAPPDIRRIPSVRGSFPDEAMRTPGTLIATTWGRELERSNHELLGAGTVVLLAHNLAIPTGIEGLELMRRACRPGVVVIPGQVLTLGGALTSRLEWFSRQAGITTFDKPMAHEVVRRVVAHWIVGLVHARDAANPYEAMLSACAQRAIAA